MHIDGSSNEEGDPDPSGAPSLNLDLFSSPLFSQCLFHSSRQYLRISLLL
jgi:hypothetical protein